MHIPIVTNLGSMCVVNLQATHLPADGSVYFIDTRVTKLRLMVVSRIGFIWSQHWGINR